MTARAACGWGRVRRSCSSIPGCGSGAALSRFEDKRGDLRITAITGTPGERVWITSAGGGVVQFMFDDGLLSAASNLGSSSEGGLDTDTVRAAVVDQDNTLWFASPVGVFRYQLWAWLETDSRLDGLVVNDLLYDQNGGLWVATGGEGVQWRRGLYAHPTTYYPSDNGLPSEFVNDLEEDAEGASGPPRPTGWRCSNAANGHARWTAAACPRARSRRSRRTRRGCGSGRSAGLAYHAPLTGELTVEALFAGESISVPGA